jgi:hypothetical protein
MSDSLFGIPLSTYKDNEWYKNLSDEGKKQFDEYKEQQSKKSERALYGLAAFAFPSILGAAEGFARLFPASVYTPNWESNFLYGLNSTERDLLQSYRNLEFKTRLPEFNSNAYINKNKVDFPGFLPQSLRRYSQDLNVNWPLLEANTSDLNPENYLNTKLTKVTTPVPNYGPDIGGFYRKNEELLNNVDPKLKKIYTVVPKAGSSRFASRVLPELIQSIYSDPSIRPDTLETYTRAYAAPATALLPESTTYKDVPTRDLYRQFREKKLDIDGQIELLNRIDVNQGRGRSVSSTLWGTISDYPRTEYASIRLGAITSPDPEVVVSLTNLEPSLETKYLMTPHAATPYINRFSDPPGEYRTGPHWGAVEGEVKAGTRRKRDISGDVSFSSNLIRNRGALSLSVIQAIQKENGLPITRGYGQKALDEGLKSLQSHFGLATPGEVVDRFAVNVPRLGQTTNPRQVSYEKELQLVSNFDGSIKFPERYKKEMDLGRALSNAGYDPSLEGLQKFNQDVNNTAGQRFMNFNRFRGSLPGIGSALGLMDPDAARHFARSYSLKESNPEKSHSEFKQGATAFGVNTAIGTGLGVAANRFLKILGERAPQLVASVTSNPRTRALFRTGGLVGTGAGLYTLADAVTEGLTGKGLTVRGGEAFRQHVSPYIIGANPQQMIEQLFPTPKSISANTPNGVAEIRPWTPSVSPIERIQQTTSDANQQIRSNIDRGYAALDRVFGGVLPGGEPKRGERRADGDVYVDRNWGYQNPKTAARLFREQQQARVSQSNRPQPGTTSSLGGSRGSSSTGRPAATRPPFRPASGSNANTTTSTVRRQSSTGQRRTGQNPRTIDLRNEFNYWTNRLFGS